jgi:predicted AAA+ superfamily ATPase
MGHLLEHVVLESLLATPDLPRVHYWRDKSGREVDFVLPHGETVDAIEVKWSLDAFDGKHLAYFRSLYPRGENLLITGATTVPETRIYRGVSVQVVPVEALRQKLLPLGG